MSYRDVQTGIGLGSTALGFVQAIPGIGQFATLLSDIVGAFGLASEQEAYNRMITAYYATPVEQGGGFNPHHYRQTEQRRMRMFAARGRF